jgi:hypothetical protein
MKQYKKHSRLVMLLFISLFFINCEKSKKAEFQKTEPKPTTEIKPAQVNNSEATIEIKSVQVNEPKVAILNPYLVGDWDNSESGSDFIIRISIDAKGVLTYSDGPFSEKMEIKFEKDTMKLYFVSIDGSNSFNEATNNGNSKNESKKLIGTVALKDKLLIIESYGDEYGQLGKGKYILKKYN